MANPQYFFCCYFPTFLGTRPQGSIFHSKPVPRDINRISLEREFFGHWVKQSQTGIFVCGTPLILMWILIIDLQKEGFSPPGTSA